MISKRTKYGLKALVYIAKKDNKEPVQISEISKEENISRKFLESILLTLKKAGFVKSKKGKTGGYYLLKQPDQIKLASVMRILEGPIALVPCVSLNYYEKCDDCKSEENCPIHDIMIQVRDNSLAIFENNTIADMIEEKV